MHISRGRLLALVVVTALLLTPAVYRAVPAAAAQAITSAVLFVGSINSPTAVAHTDGVLQAIVNAVTPGTAATNLGKAEDAAHTSADVGVVTLGVRKDTNAQLTGADGDYTIGAHDAYGAAFSRQDHPNAFRCTVNTSTAITIQAVGGSCAAPGAGLSLYVTDILFAASAAGIAADAHPSLKYGTGGTCGTGTVIFWQALTAAAIVFQDNRSVPIKIPANNEICWISTTAGSKALVIGGFIAP